MKTFAALLALSLAGCISAPRTQRAALDAPVVEVAAVPAPPTAGSR